MQGLEKKELQKQFWSQIQGKRYIMSLADVVPFYIAWVFCGFLMIERNMGRTAMVILTLAVCYFEVSARTYFGLADYAYYYKIFAQMFPPSWTLGECLKMFRSCFVFAVMLLIFALDLTLDRKN